MKVIIRVLTKEFEGFSKISPSIKAFRATHFLFIRSEKKLNCYQKFSHVIITFKMIELKVFVLMLCLLLVLE